MGFRWSAAREASGRDITGFVRNMPDGSVYIEAEGTREQLAEFAAWCRKGPGVGFVDSAKISEHPPAGYREFRIKH
ncbi:MAG: acylphosphatase [Marinilabiliales bacterium]|nr:acylphosphatase [Marinilabiliales bacterium]